ncbi:MAG: cell division protein SepF [Coriobacteriales bacterium]
MGVFDNMKAKLGFGSQPEWQDDAAQGFDQGYGQDYEQGYDDYAPEQEQGYDAYDEPYEEPAHDQDLLSFDSYNPDNFAHVTVKGNPELKVASLDDSGNDSYFARRSGYGSNIGTSSSRHADSGKVRSFNERSSSSASSATWDTPEDPAFLSASSVIARSRHLKPEEHLAIVKARAYADVEKVAAAARTGKIVVLVLKETKPELAKRVLDFSFGVASALNGSVDKAAEKVFIISRSDALSDEESAYLRSMGII